MAKLSDLVLRSKTAFFLIAVVLAVLWIDNFLIPLFLMLFITFAMNEYFRFWHRKDVYPHTLLVLVPAYSIPWLFYLRGPLLLPGFLLLVYLILLSVARFPGSRYIPNFLSELAAAVFGILYISLLPSTIIPLRRFGFHYALYPLILTWLYDTFAYIVGSLIGRHRLYEKLTPKKTVAGTIAGFVLTFPCSVLLNAWWFEKFTLIHALIITIGIGVLGTVGDLLESGMKREVGLKDASNIFPGHGGFLDRMDSLIFNIPFFYLFVVYYG